MHMILKTDAINEFSRLDPRYTCDSDNSSPELHWEGFPNNTAEFAITLEEEGSGPSQDKRSIHWLVYNIPVSITHLPAGIPPQEALPNGILQGINSFGKLGYTGPCPGYSEKPHKYIFTVYAMKEKVPIPHRTQYEVFFEKIRPSILASGKVETLYKRSVQKAG